MSKNLSAEDIERRVRSAATVLHMIPEQAVAEHLMAEGLSAEDAYLIVKAASLLSRRST